MATTSAVLRLARTRASVHERSEVHHGSFKLDIGGQPVDRLEGYYWTDRNTMGELEFDEDR